MRIIFIGRPGSGKGTQAVRIAERLKIPHIATGDILRAAVKEKTELGLKAEGFMKAGQLVPDELVCGMVVDRIKGAENGFLLDGFPRNVSQNEALQTGLKENDIRLDKVICIDLDAEIILRRSEDRRLCENDKCSAIYNISSLPPAKEGVCDECGSKLYQRPDDRRETMEDRLKVYDEETEPLLAEFDKEDLVSHVEGNGSLESVRTNILNVLSKKGEQ
jgi:adenylate kinase